ncbi:MAG TPA: dTDP-4-dehydrorhamnose 3,5-epimerase [Planctomycetaceae bacterium]|jgi:dTDP-4-dehydrorhamnose 3,5-epimerase|nr:dTDP-4-dehydrorhamnose 3,5-epimerase [Planctomycetaceae bacterium]
MKFLPTPLAGCVIVEPQLFPDERGHFFETYHRAKFHAAGITVDFVQDNQSRSLRNVVRGLHYQLTQPQAKLVRVVLGEVFDVAVDLRRGSATRGQWFGVRLSATSGNQLYLPAGFAHGFCALSEYADVQYKCSELYAPRDERTIRWNDPDLNISWPLSGEAIVSARDQSAPGWREADLP